MENDMCKLINWAVMLQIWLVVNPIGLKINIRKDGGKSEMAKEIISLGVLFVIFEMDGAFCWIRIDAYTLILKGLIFDSVVDECTSTWNIDSEEREIMPAVKTPDIPSDTSEEILANDTEYKESTNYYLEATQKDDYQPCTTPSADNKLKQNKTKKPMSGGNIATSFIRQMSLKHGLVCILILLFPVALMGQSVSQTETSYKAILSDSTQNEKDHRKLECDISACGEVFKVIFEKKNFYTNTEWIQVFEGMNKTYHHALKTDVGYTLKNRTDYTAFRTKHMLYIKPVILNDHGKWRCSAYDVNENAYKSRALDVFIYEPARVSEPSDDMTIIATHSSFIFNCAGTGKKPTITWQKDGENIPDTDIRFTSSQSCNVDSCRGSMVSNPTMCVDTDQYTGVYTCVISSKLPYQSSERSPNMNVLATGKVCHEEYNTLKITIGVMLLAFVVMLSIIIVGACVCLK